MGGCSLSISSETALNNPSAVHDYFVTVTVKVAVCVMVPDAAVTVRVLLPTGVPAYLFPPLQPPSETAAPTPRQSSSTIVHMLDNRLRRRGKIMNSIPARLNPPDAFIHAGKLALAE